MSSRCVKSLLLACAGVGALLAATAAANAGGFAIREDSAYGHGSSFAGVAAGGDVSSMFWNPATMTQMPGVQTEIVASGIIPSAKNNASPASTLFPFGLGGTDNTADSALVPSGYISWQLNPSFWLGLSVNAPFGLSVSFPDAWAGRNYAAGSTSLKTYNATPSFAYRLNDWISIGAGVQIQYGKANLSNGLPVNGFGVPPGLGNQLNINGDGWGYGFTAGLTLTPTPSTTIGIGYRSAINQKIEGTLTLPAGPLFNPPFSTPGAVSTTLNLPDIVSIGLRQKLNPQWTLLGTVEWSNWSRIGTSTTNTTVLGTPVAIHFNYDNGWFFALGAEYQWTEQLAVRAGIGYEKTPITDMVRIPLLPDNDRTWLSAGLTYNFTKALALDLAYSHLFVKNTPINVVAGNPSFNGAIAYVGTVDSHIDIISVALKYRWDAPAPAPTKGLYTK
jgi:long-chain fatty acid transport protein